METEGAVPLSCRTRPDLTRQLWHCAGKQLHLLPIPPVTTLAGSAGSLFKAHCCRYSVLGKILHAPCRKRSWTFPSHEAFNSFTYSIHVVLCCILIAVALCNTLHRIFDHSFSLCTAHTVTIVVLLHFLWLSDVHNQCRCRQLWRRLQPCSPIPIVVILSYLIAFDCFMLSAVKCTVQVCKSILSTMQNVHTVHHITWCLQVLSLAYCSRLFNEECTYHLFLLSCTHSVCQSLCTSVYYLVIVYQSLH